MTVVGGVTSPYLYYSADGLTWTNGGTGFVPTGPNQLVWFANHFVANMVSGPIFGSWVCTSTDGIDWGLASVGASIAYLIDTGATLYALTTSTQRWTTTNATSWTSSSYAALSPLSGACAWTNSRFLSAASGGGNTTFRYSTDGSTWVNGTTLTGFVGTILAGGAGIFVLLAGSLSALVSTADYYTTTDGITWTPQTLPLTMEALRIKFMDGLFWAFGQVSGPVAYALTSPDGVNWTQYEYSTATARSFDLAFNNQLYISVNGGSDEVFTTSSPFADPATFIDRHGAPSSIDARCVAAAR